MSLIALNRRSTSSQNTKPSCGHAYAYQLQRGFTLIELVMVLLILAILAGSALSMVDYQVEESKHDVTTQILEAIDYAVLGPANARGADGTHAVSGFVADCGRLPYSLEELYIQPTSVVQFGFNEPAGDGQVQLSGGWNGPYIQPAIGANVLIDGWAEQSNTTNLQLYKSDGTAVTNYPEQVAIVQSLGRDQLVGGTNYDADRSVTFESGYPTSRWRTSLIVRVFYNDLQTNPDPAKGSKIVVRVYGPKVDDSTFDVTLATIGQKIVNLDTTAPVTVNFELTLDTNGDLVEDSRLAIGPRIIRAYQLDDEPGEEDDLLDSGTGEPGENLEALSVPTRLTVSHETSDISLILKDK